MATTKKAAAKPKTAKKAPLYTEHKMLVPNWAKVPTGTKFTATISKREVSGRVFKWGKVCVLCNNTTGNMRDTTGVNRLGYSQAYYINDGSLEKLLDRDVIIKSITLDPKFKIPPMLKIGSYTVTFNEKGVMVGCQQVTKEMVLKIAAILNKKK